MTFTGTWSFLPEKRYYFVKALSGRSYTAETVITMKIRPRAGGRIKTGGYQKNTSFLFMRFENADNQIFKYD